MKKEILHILETLSLSRKLQLLSGANFWESEALPEFDLPSIVMNDGPFGLRKPQDNSGSGISEKTLPATLFPTTSGLASSFDRDLLNKVGQTIGLECIDQGVDLLLGPGLNIKRSPLCGRNFEYFSEDPLVSSELAGALVSGLQSKGIGATIKHYALNNQEKERFTTNPIVDERALHEIYLKPFHDLIKVHKPYAVMCSYNQVNGLHASRNPFLLTQMLRQEAKFDGLIMSDWGAVVNPVDSALAGLNLEMPGHADIKELEKAVADGILSIEKVNELLVPLLTLMINKKERKLLKKRCDYDQHFLVAQETAENCAVLLQNNENTLPLKLNSKIGLIGGFAKHPRVQGSGSSKINPDKLVTLYETFVEKEVNFVYADGYLPSQIDINEVLIEEAIKVAKIVDSVVICVGLPESYEVEGYDRKNINMPPSHNELIRRISEVNSKVIVILSNGSPVTMPWLSSVNSVLLTHLAGGATGPATYNLLFGLANPSGKLSESYPISLWRSVPGEAFKKSSQNVPYIESLYVGYRHFDTYNEKVLFPFGYGLSYTKFLTSDLKLSEDEDAFNISLSITNIGRISGKEVVGIYVGRPQSMLYGPKKELKAFSKLSLAPGDKQKVTLTIKKEDLKVYDPVNHRWVLEKTPLDFYVGINVEEALKSFSVELTEGEELTHLEGYKKDNAAYYNHQKYEPVLAAFKTLYGKPLPLVFASRKRPFTLENNISDTTDYFLGRKVYSMMTKSAKKMSGEDIVLQEMAVQTVKEIPFRSLLALTGGAISKSQRDAIVDLVNGKIISGAFKFISKQKK